MTRYEVHSMIAGMDIGETMDLEVCKSLIEKYGSSRDIELLITDNGIDMTYGEVADQLNRYHKREEILKESDSVNDLILSVLDLQEKLKELEEENKELKQQLRKIQDSFEFRITKNYEEFDQDKIYVKDANTKLYLDGDNLFIEVYIPQANECHRFRCRVVGRSLMEEYIENYNLKEDLE